MALTFTNHSWWLWARKDHESPVSSGSPLSAASEFDLGLQEPDSLKFSSVKGAKMRPASRRVTRKWHGREERRIDKEYDLVLIPSDGGCLSGSESDDSDWSVGWLEPHAPDFLSDSESENSFAVLVPCYGRGQNEQVENSKNQLLGAIVSTNLNDGYSAEKYMEEWLSSLQNS